MIQAFRKPCFYGIFDGHMDTFECQQGRRSKQYAEPSCRHLTQGGKWETCGSGKKSKYYPGYKQYHFTKPCSKCSGSGRVPK